MRHTVSIEPGFTGAWFNLGNTFKVQEKYEEAIASFRKAVKLNPNFQDPYLSLGILLKELDRNERSVRSLSQSD